MADNSFDIVSKVDAQEILNAIQQTEKELQNRFDLKDTDTKLEWNAGTLELTISTATDFSLRSVVDIFHQRLVKRNVPAKALQLGPVDSALGGTVRQKLTFSQGISTEKAKDINKRIKASGLKVQTQIQGDQIRVVGKKLDDLQAVIQLLRNADLDIHLDFVNYR
jgi:cyclic-di-GMP-binding protein